MRVAVFSTKPYDQKFFERANEGGAHELAFLEPRLRKDTASLASGFETVCAFVNDVVDADVVAALAKGGTRLIALRSAGFNNVDLEACRANGVTVVRVPAYSPNAVAEHTVALVLALNRNIHRAYNRVREGNFALDGLIGFDMVGKTVGVIGTGKIGAAACRIFHGFGCRVLAHDPFPNEELGLEYVDLDRLYAEADIVTLHLPLSKESHHLIDADALAKMKDGVTLINTSRGGLLDTPAVIEGLKSGKIGRLGLDVYEEEGALFFEDRSHRPLQDDVFARLLTFPNVLVTGHQAFLTEEALTQIAQVTLANVTAFAEGRAENVVA
ncbi:MAG: 2-hydroxyacid dehydrogenase [Fimbriimonas sp.]